MLCLRYASQAFCTNALGPHSLANMVRVSTIGSFQAFEKGEKNMASNHFDELTRMLASSTSRRQTIKAIFVGALGSALTFGGLGTALALPNCGSKESHCKADNECCSYTCDKGKSQCSCRASAISCNHSYECCSNKCFFSGVAGKSLCM
jgi:hypothetical protein